MLRRRHALPGFGLTLGLSLSYLALIVLIPLDALALKSATIGPVAFWTAVTTPRALAAYRVTFGCAALAGLVNLVLGPLLALAALSLLPVAWRHWKRSDA